MFSKPHYTLTETHLDGSTVIERVLMPGTVMHVLTSEYGVDKVQAGFALDQCTRAPGLVFDLHIAEGDKIKWTARLCYILRS